MEVFVDNNQVLLKTYIDSILGNLDNLPLTDKSSLESCLMGILYKIVLFFVFIFYNLWYNTIN